MKKQEKKFVLAALALLAITMVLLPLSGCKNDTVPEPTRYTVKFDKNAEDASGEMQSQIFTEGVEQELSANQFRRATYTFSGWSEDKAAPAPTYKDKAKFKATKDTTLYAVWTDNGTVASVTFTPPTDTKFYLGESIEVSLTSEDGATIQYHLGDGSWKDYDAGGKIQVTGDTTITARAAKEGLKPSAVTSATYTVRKLEGITVTTLPAQTVYSERQSFDPTGMVVTATYEGGKKREVTGWTTNFDTVAAGKGLGKEVTVSYTEGDTTQTFTFTVDVASYKFTETVGDYEYPAGETGTMTGGTYKKFGDWPQTIKEEGVEIGAGTLVRGGLTYHVGSDGNYYVKAEENAKGSGTEYLYSNGDQVGQGGTSTKWFKVEPIVWRVLTTNYKAPEGGTAGNALLLAEKILTGGIKWAYGSNNYMQSYIRQWLNGNSGTGETSDYNGDAGFLQTAFTQSALGKIAPTTVYNSAASTTDKIFLLSQQEATNSDYGFAASSNGDSTRIRVTTDYAKATGVYQGDSTEGYGGWWWLRSPRYGRESNARVIGSNGDADIHDYYVNNADGGVVPALSISLTEN